MTLLRNRARQEYRNNPWIKKGVRSLVVSEIGKGIVPHCRAEEEAFREAARQLWKISQTQLDADGVTTFYGLQTLCSQARNMSGEVFIRRRPRRIDTPGLAVPLQIQILESDFLPLHKKESLPNGRYIDQGIEFNRRGQRLAYHFYLKHPGDTYAGFVRARDTVRVPASQVIHHFIPTRPGQIRGEVITAQSLLPAKDFREYSDTEMQRKKTRAPFTGFITREQGAGYQYDGLIGDEINEESHPSTGEELTPPPVDMVPGTMLEGQPGEKLDLFDADDNGQGYADFMRWKLLEMSAGLDIPYEIMSGDWSEVNDRLVRAILNEFHRYIEGLQDQWMIPQVCMRVWQWWMEWAVFTDKLSAPGFSEDPQQYLACEWRPHAWPYVHPEQDIKAAVLAIENDISSLPQEASKRGRDFEDNIRENAEYKSARKDIYEELGVDLPEEMAMQMADSSDDDDLIGDQDDD